MNPQDVIPSIKDNVKKILEKYPSTRNSDEALMFHYVREILGIDIKFLDFNQIFSVSYESLRRIRQKFQENDLYLPTDPKIAKQRGRNAAEMRKLMPGLEVD